MKIDYRPPYRGAVIAGVSVFGLYLLTLAPTTAFWDTSEYIATAHILGIPHPPGNPLFVVVGRVWDVLLSPLGLPVAIRINLLAAATSAAASGFFFLVAHRILRPFTDGRWPALLGAGASVLIGGGAYTVWNQSTVNEKVYTLSVLVIAAVTWLALRWRDRRDEPGGLRYLLGAIYLLVLGSTSHLMSVLPAPALGVFVLLTAPAVLVSPRFWTRAVPLVVVGLSFNFFLPIRAARNPAINEAEPTCESPAQAAVSIYTMGRAGCPALSAALTRQQYSKPPLSARQAPLADQLLNWFQYFDWQWARGADPAPQPGNARLPVTLLFLALGLGGFWVTWKADRETFWYLTVLTATLTAGLVIYLNFRFGYSLAPEVANQDLHEVRERDYFFVAGFLVWGVLSGIGLTGLWKMLARQAGSLRLTAPVLLLAFVPLAFNRGWAGRSGDYAARDWAYDLLMSVEPYGVIFTNGDNDTFPLWYLQEVEEVRADVTVVVMQYLYTSWYPKQLQRLSRPENQRPFRPDPESGLYRAPPKGPGAPIVSLSAREMDGIGPGLAGENYTVPLGEVAVQYPEGTRLDRAQRLSLAIIRDSIGERPIYFSSRAGLLRSLGLDEWGVRQGLVTKLVLKDHESDSTVFRTARNLGGAWVDLDRSLTLARDVYRYRGLRDRAVWAERATLNIPFQYYVMFLQLADAADRAGRPQDLVRSLLEEADEFLVTARGGRLGTPS